MSEKGYVYVLKCSDNSYYTGAARDWKKRIDKHNNGGVKYTKSRLPAKIVFLKVFARFSDALQFESKVKSWKKRSSIEKMFSKEDNIINNKFQQGPIV